MSRASQKILTKTIPVDFAKLSAILGAFRRGLIPLQNANCTQMYSDRHTFHPLLPKNAKTHFDYAEQLEVVL